MSLTLAQIFALNPTNVVADTDLFYLVQSPYTPGTDAAILGADLKTALGKGTVTTITAGTGITLTPNPITVTGTVALTVPVTEILGGTNQTSYTLGDILYSSAANTLAKLAGNITIQKQFLSQTGTGVISAAPIWSTISGSDITGAALTKVNDTNVTLTLGGTPTTALLRAVSLTLGWTGTLAETRGGTGQSTYILGDILYSSALNTLSKLSGNITTAKQFLSQTGTGAVSAAPVWSTISGGDITGAALTKVDDTNVTLTLGGTPSTALLRATSLTLGWSGELAVSRGGTGAGTFTPYTVICAGTVATGPFQNVVNVGTAGQVLTSNGPASLPTWQPSGFNPVANSFERIMLLMGG